MGFLDSLGRAAAAKVESFSALCSFTGETAAAILLLPFRPRRFRFGDFAMALQRASWDALAVVSGAGVLLGVILAFESATALKMFGAEVYVSDLLAIGIFRELGPLITAIILAGRTSSAFAAEIGTMKAGEEIDALVTMGLKPVRFLVPPRIAATVVAMPVLTVCAELAALFGGAAVLRMMDVPPAVYWDHVKSTTGPWMISYGLLKSALFGFIAGFMGCFCGLKTEPTADGVGKAATAAVVGSIVAVGVADGIIAAVGYLMEG